MRAGAAAALGRVTEFKHANVIFSHLYTGRARLDVRELILLDYIFIQHYTYPYVIGFLENARVLCTPDDENIFCIRILSDH